MIPGKCPRCGCNLSIDTMLNVTGVKIVQAAVGVGELMDSQVNPTPWDTICEPYDVYATGDLIPFEANCRNCSMIVWKRRAPIIIPEEEFFEEPK
ncbi:MAG: hypothetical protein ACW96U_00810 [Candidatus Heimdallarchaeaceae archaeon]|jgi:hypothetical protein